MKKICFVECIIVLFCILQLTKAQLPEWKVSNEGLLRKKEITIPSTYLVVLSTNPRIVKMQETMKNIEDFERCAPALLDPLSRDYIWAGSGNGQTLWENKEAYKRIWIKKRVLKRIVNYTSETTVLGQKIGLPIGIAPTAGHSLFHPEGEKGTAKGASSMGAIMILNSLALRSLEQIAASVPAGTVKWMQTYIYPNRNIVINIVRRAERAGYSALVVTVDEPYDFEIKCSLRSRFFEKEVPVGFPNIRARVEEIVADPSLTFDDIAWLVNVTRLPIVVKGIMTAEDAKLAAEAGASAIYVSNHGGREIDGCLPTIEVLHEIVSTVNSAYPSIEVYVDGGIRSGSDVFKALALGAKAVFIGRPALWGLTMGGKEGVKKVLSILKQEFTEVMIHAGFNNPTQITYSSVVKKQSCSP